MSVTWVAMVSLGFNQLISGILAGSTGFGGAVIAQLLWGVEGEILHDPLVGNLQVLLGCLQIANAVGFIVLFSKRKHWRFIRWEYVIAFFPGMALFNPLGTYTLTTKPPAVLKQFLGIVFLVISTLQITLRIVRSSPSKAPRESASTAEETGSEHEHSDAVTVASTAAECTTPGCGVHKDNTGETVQELPALSLVTAKANELAAPPTKQQQQRCSTGKERTEGGKSVGLQGVGDEENVIAISGSSDDALETVTFPTTTAAAENNTAREGEGGVAVDVDSTTAGALGEEAGGAQATTTRWQRSKVRARRGWDATKRYVREKLLHWHILAAVLVGCVSGFLSGLFGTPGPPIILYISVVGGMEKGEVRATYVFLTLLTFPIAIASAVRYNIYQAYLWPMYCLTPVVAVVAYLLGKWLHNRINVEMLLMMILTLVWFTGVAFIRLFEPNTLTWVGLGLALASVLIMGGSYAIVRYRCRRTARSNANTKCDGQGKDP